jgi:hypothetical protein
VASSQSPICRWRDPLPASAGVNRSDTTPQRDELARDLAILIRRRLRQAAAGRSATDSIAATDSPSDGKNQTVHNGKEKA